MSQDDQISKRLQEQMAELTLERIGQAGLDNAQNNDPAVKAGNSILDLQQSDLMEGDSALIIAAGPSLHRFDTAAMIRDSGFDGIIVSTESSLSWCLRNGIQPDMTVTVDPHPDRIVRWFGDPKLEEHSVLGDDYFSRQEMDPAFRQDELKNNQELVDLVDRHAPDIKIAISTSASTAVAERVSQCGMPAYWWNPFYDDYDIENSMTRQVYELNGLPCLNAGGNVGTASWVIAHAILGKTKIGLLGMDFSYYGDTSFEQSQYYPELVSHFGEENLEAIYEKIFNPYTKTEFHTDPAYKWYRDVFLEMAAEAIQGGVETFNCTGGGILFGDNVEFTTFEKFVSQSRD
jgi:hypothetical protein